MAVQTDTAAKAGRKGASAMRAPKKGGEAAAASPAPKPRRFGQVEVDPLTPASDVVMTADQIDIARSRAVAAMLTPETVFAAIKPFRGTEVWGSPRRHMSTSPEAMMRAGAERMQGAAEALTARSYRTGCEPDHGLLFIAQGLFDEAHLLFTAAWAARRRRENEERLEEVRREHRQANRQSRKPAPQKGRRS